MLSHLSAPGMGPLQATWCLTLSTCASCCLLSSSSRPGSVFIISLCNKEAKWVEAGSHPEFCTPSSYVATLVCLFSIPIGISEL